MKVADMFGVDRLKKLCEQEMLNAMTVDTAAQILLAADERNAQVRTLRDVVYCIIIMQLLDGALKYSFQ